MADSPNFLIWASLSTFVLVVIVSIMGLFGGNQMPVDGKTILITGGSEGMGLAAARQLSAKGANIVIAARSVDKLESAIKEIQAAAKNPASQRFHYISADVSKPAYAGPLIAEATQWNNGRSLDIVWCIAGIATPQLFLDMEMDSMRRHMDVNYFGTAEMSHAILKEWLAVDAPIEKEARHLILTCTTAIFLDVPGYLPYVTSKWAIRGLADTLRLELGLYPQNVQLHLVCPGTILSAAFEREQKVKPGITKKIEEMDPEQTPEEVAQRAIKKLEAGQYMITVNWFGALMRWGALGSSRDSILDTLMAAFLALIMPIVLFVMGSDVKNWKKKYGHPGTWKKEE
ncbi:unnamed protein product [Clonostachys rosea]|uniref:3-dehydrosphinganine reductase n=1 Tax=Bionectria ochroleuca TaxID=29856 RepID=A0ABY6UPY3_BIOOC|nr:unnamed protein product [Clonostachys rosea]